MSIVSEYEQRHIASFICQDAIIWKFLIPTTLLNYLFDSTGLGLVSNLISKNDSCTKPGLPIGPRRLLLSQPSDLKPGIRHFNEARTKAWFQNLHEVPASATAEPRGRNRRCPWPGHAGMSRLRWSRGAARVRPGPGQAPTPQATLPLAGISSADLLFCSAPVGKNKGGNLVGARCARGC